MTKKLFILFSFFFITISVSYAQEGNCEIWHNSDSVNFNPQLNTLHERWTNYRSLGYILDNCINNETIAYKTYWTLFIDSKGKVVDAKPVKNAGECEKDIIGQLKMMPNFVPAEIDNKPVCCTYILTLARY